MKALKIIVILLIAAANFACGSSKSIDFNADPSTLGLDPQSLAYCNIVTAPNISGRIKAQTNDTIEISFDANLAKALPGSYVLKFYKWYVRPDDSTYLNPTPMKIVIRDAQSGQLVTGEWPEISQAMVDEFGKIHNFPGLTLSQFLTNKIVILAGIETEYAALRLSVQNGASHISSIDTLIPTFTADPNVYAESHSPILSALHPNASMTEQGWTVQEFKQRTNSYCF